MFPIRVFVCWILGLSLLHAAQPNLPLKHLELFNYDFFTQCDTYPPILYGQDFDFAADFPIPGSNLAASVAGGLRTEGRWFVDPSGRKVLLRGVNSSRRKLEDLELLQKWGFNLIRVVLYWDDYETADGVFDESYLDGLVTYLDAARDRGLYVILDLHQWFLSSAFGFRWGIGLPEHLFEGYPDELGGFQDALTDFWQDRELHRAIGRLWQRVIGRLGRREEIIAYDLFNEPNPLPHWYRGSTYFNREILVPFYRTLIKAIREVDAETTICYEPPTSDQYLDIEEIDPARLGDPKLCYLPHHYTLHHEDNLPDIPLRAGPLDLGKLEPEEWRNGYCGPRRAFQRDLGESLRMADLFELPVLIGEWGVLDSRTNTQKYLADMLDTQDEYQLGSAIWSFGSAGRSLDLLGRDGVPRSNTLTALVRPFPRRIAGLPERYGYAVRTRTFTLTYQTEGATGTTELYLPTQLIYTAGYVLDLTIDAGQPPSTSFDASRNLLSLIHREDAQRIELRVTPTSPLPGEESSGYYDGDIARRGCLCPSTSSPDPTLIPMGLLALLLVAFRRRST